MPVCALVCMLVLCQSLPLLFVCSKNHTYIRCCPVAGEHSGGQTDVVPVYAFAWGRRSGDHSTVAKCTGWGNRILSDPPGEAGKVFLEELMSTLRSEGGVELARQSGGSGEGGVQLAEEESDWSRGLEEVGTWTSKRASSSSCLVCLWQRLRSWSCLCPSLYDPGPVSYLWGRPISSSARKGY